LFHYEDFRENLDIVSNFCLTPKVRHEADIRI
jgi:hypothetical protein